MAKRKRAAALRVRNVTIRREGEARWRVTGNHHCGKASSVGPDGRTSVRYSVEIICSRRLDERGFLIDQSSIDRLIHRLAQRGTTMSCEQLVQHVARKVESFFRRNEPRCEARYIRVSLSPAPFLGTMSTELW